MRRYVTAMGPGVKQKMLVPLKIEISFLSFCLFCFIYVNLTLPICVFGFLFSYPVTGSETPQDIETHVVGVIRELAAKKSLAFRVNFIAEQYVKMQPKRKSSSKNAPLNVTLVHEILTSQNWTSAVHDEVLMYLVGQQLMVLQHTSSKEYSYDEDPTSSTETHKSKKAGVSKNGEVFSILNLDPKLSLLAEFDNIISDAADRNMQADYSVWRTSANKTDDDVVKDIQKYATLYSKHQHSFEDCDKKVLENSEMYLSLLYYIKRGLITALPTYQETRINMTMLACGTLTSFCINIHS